MSFAYQKNNILKQFNVLLSVISSESVSYIE